MAVEEFRQKLKSSEAPKGNRIAKVMEPVAIDPGTNYMGVSPLDAVVAEASQFVGVEPIGRHVLMDRMVDETRAAEVRKFMNTPVYPSSADARARSLHLGRSRGGKTLPHPFAG